MRLRQEGHLFSVASLTAAHDGRIVRHLTGEPDGGSLALHVGAQVEGAPSFGIDFS